MLNNTLGARLKQLRLQKGLSQEKVGRKINVSKQALYKYENGIVTNIPADKIEKLAEIYEVSPAYIMGWEIPSHHISNTASVCSSDEQTFQCIKTASHLPPLVRDRLIHKFAEEIEATERKFSHNIKMIRQNRNLSKFDCSTCLGIALETLEHLEKNCHGMLDSTLIKKVSDIFSIPDEDLFL